MGDLLFYVAAFVFVIALIVLGAWIWRALLDNGVNVPGNTLFKAGRDKRIGAIETASVDSRRKLILIRRDNVEHLIMTGGPVDVVIETGIAAANADFADNSDEYRYDGATLEERLYGARNKNAEATTAYAADD
jgi:hypothetical protein